MSKCLNPTTAWICGTKVSKDGIVSKNLIFSFRSAMEYYTKIAPSYGVAVNMLRDNEIQVECGKCMACRIRQRKDMSVRLAHEYRMAERSCFITLTYDDEHLPHTESGDPTLVPADVQRFLKRLRRHLEYTPKRQCKNGLVRDHITTRIRYFAVGEYGHKYGRPHYHILIFGWSPSDARFFFGRNGHDINVSAQLQALWPYGYSTVEDVGVCAAKYCARYVTKKLTDDRMLPDGVVAEFFLQSVRDGGMGAPWLKVYKANLLTGLVNVTRKDGSVSRCSIPRYYISRLRTIDRDLFLAIRDQRIMFVRDLRNHPVSDPLCHLREVDCWCYRESQSRKNDYF